MTSSSTCCLEPDMTLITADDAADNTAAAADHIDNDIYWSEFPPPPQSSSSQWGEVDPSLLHNVVSWDDETDINNINNNSSKSGNYDKLSFDESEFWSSNDHDETNIFRTVNVVSGSDSSSDDYSNDDDNVDNNLDGSNYFDDLDLLLATIVTDDKEEEGGGAGDYKTATTTTATPLKDGIKSSSSPPRERRNNTDRVCMNRLNDIVEKLSPRAASNVAPTNGGDGVDSTEDVASSSSPVSVAVVLPSSSSSPQQQPQLFLNVEKYLAASSLLPPSPDNNVSFQGAMNRLSFLSERLKNDLEQRKQHHHSCTEDKENESPQLKQTYSSSNSSVGIHLLETRLLLNKLTLQAEEEEMSYQLDTMGRQQQQQCQSNSNNKSERKDMDGEEDAESLIIHMRKISQLSMKCRELQQQLDKDKKGEKKKRTTAKHSNSLERQLEISLKCDKESRLEHKMKCLEDKYARKKTNKKKMGELRGDEEGRLRLLSEGESGSSRSSSSNKNNNWEVHRQWRKERIKKARDEYLVCLAANCDEESVNLVKKLFS